MNLSLPAVLRLLRDVADLCDFKYYKCNFLLSLYHLDRGAVTQILFLSPLSSCWPPFLLDPGVEGWPSPTCTRAHSVSFSIINVFPRFPPETGTPLRNGSLFFSPQWIPFLVYSKPPINRRLINLVYVSFAVLQFCFFEFFSGFDDSFCNAPLVLLGHNYRPPQTLPVHPPCIPHLSFSKMLFSPSGASFLPNIFLDHAFHTSWFLEPLRPCPLDGASERVGLQSEQRFLLYGIHFMEHSCALKQTREWVCLIECKAERGFGQVLVRLLWGYLNHHSGDLLFGESIKERIS